MPKTPLTETPKRRKYDELRIICSITERSITPRAKQSKKARQVDFERVKKRDTPVLEVNDFKRRGGGVEKPVISR